MQHTLLRRTVTRLARGLDRAFSGTALNPPRRFTRVSRAEQLDHDARIHALEVIASFYGRAEFETRENALLPRPEPIAPQIVRARRFGTRGEVVDLQWPSLFEPLWSRQALADHLAALPARELEALNLPASGVQLFDRSADLREKYLRAQGNRTAHARWFRHDGAPRPCVVLIHGYMGGSFALEQRLWPVKRLFRSGFDVVMTVLPLHGPRRAEARGYRPPAFPSSDVRFTIEGFRQLVFDHRAIFDYLHSAGIVRLGVMGMSLGGYSAALLSTLEESLRFGVLVVPLAAIEDFVHSNGRTVGAPTQQLAQHAALARAHSAISPYTRPALVPGERMVVVAGEADLVTGLEHARKLSGHFGAELSLFHGGHLLHAGREEAFAPVWRLLGAFASGELP
ncbi:MAG: hypothetical protein ABW321_12915 [Polyangiales bacterium]